MSEFKIYKASAGSGKTFQLTRHYLELLLRDTGNYMRILAVTFTNRAAGELKERVIKELVEIASEEYERSAHLDHLCRVLNKDKDILRKRARTILRMILHDYSHFNIGTIDHFFQQVLRAFSREAGIHSSFRLELNADNYLTGAISLLMSDLGQDNKLLGWLMKWVDYKISRDESWARIENDLKSIGFECLREQLLESLFDDWEERYSEENISRLESKINGLTAKFESRMAGISEETARILMENNISAGDFKGGGSRSVPAYMLAASHDIRFLSRKRPVKALDDPGEWYTKSMSHDEKERVSAVVDAGLGDLLGALLEFLDENEPLYHTACLIRQNLYSLGITAKLIQYINRYADLTNSLLINLTSPILSKVIGENPSPFIYEKAGTYYNHFMIDEFQDTSSLQWKNFLPLIKNSLGEGNFSMVVGDVKQSIFRWRNSNWKLMAETAARDLADFGIDTRRLESNWRSRDSIIDFNNNFFEKAPGILVERIKEDIEGYHGKDSLSPAELADIYKGLRQGKGSGKPGGYAEMIFQGDLDEESWNNKIPTLAIDLQVKYGYKPEDIVFLVRKNSQVKLLVKLLQEYKKEIEGNDRYSLDLVSSESYELRNSAAVRCIIWAARYVLDPDDRYVQARLAQEYISFRRKELSVIDYETLIKLVGGADELHELLPGTLINNRDIYSCASAARFIEEIIRILKLQGDLNESPYLMALRDVALEGIGGTGSLEDLIDWWDEQGHKYNIPMLEQAGAMRAMTIHKAKGLEFKVVVLPFCDWEMGQVNRGHTMWAKTGSSPFDMVPMVPLQYGSLLSRSSYDFIYFDEKIQIYLDNLNLLYVSFTRACDRLYAFCPAPPARASYPVSRLIGEVFGHDTNGYAVYDYGDPGTLTASDARKYTARAFKLESYDPEPFEGVSGLRQDLESGAIHRGRVMHEILEDTGLLPDLGKAVSRRVESGEFDRNEASVIFEHLDKLLRRKEILPWFSGDYRVYRERSILVPGAGEIRPDRIMENDDELIILDYKFGEYLNSHRKQVLQYRTVLKKMVSKNVRSFLLYPEQGILEEVEPTA